MHELFDMLMAAGGQLNTVTFNASGNWPAPAGVTRVESVQGRGANGTAATTDFAYVDGASATYWASGTGNTPGVYTWTSMNNFLNSARDQINSSGGSGTVAIPDLQQYAADSYSFFTLQVPYTNAIPGTAILEDVSGVWGTSGNVTASGARRIRYTYPVAATNGAASTALGKTFPGGIGGPATTSDQGSATVTPGNNYPIVVAPGGFVTITFYS